MRSSHWWIGTLVDWAELDWLLSGISAGAKGELGWPPLALFRAVLLATWYDLSEVRLSEALDDRASFRRFCGRRNSIAYRVCT
ncbi:MAG TPA: transposase [Acidisphaera sp.]|nr:transposase [Acidisphaera sp.]